MTVRWKPLLILSGLFVVVALGGLMSFAWYKGTRGTADMLARARVERKAKQYDEAKLDYQRALKLDGRNLAIHEEMADLYEEWANQAPPEKKAELRGLYLASLTNAASPSSKRVEPKRRMLTEAIRQDDVIEQVRWAKSLVTLDPNNADVHYVLAADALDGTAPNIPELRKHLKVLEAELPRRARCDWVAARAAALTNDQPRLEEILKKSRSINLPNEADATDRMALLRLRALDVATTNDVAALAGPVDAVSR
jgi:cellulose synthase operon protein C